MLILTRSDLAAVLDIADVIPAVEAAHLAVAQRAGSEGAREAIVIPGSDAQLIPMVAALGPQGAAGIKLLTDAPANPDHGLPRQQSVILLLDQQTNAVEALLDGAQITMLRTAAASAVATKYLSRSTSSTLGLIGAGTLARVHLQAIRAVRPIERVVVWSRRPETMTTFRADVEAAGLDVILADSPEQVARDSDVICTLTPARNPVLLGQWLREGTHVNAVGAPPRPEYREIDSEVLRRSRIVVDNRHVAQAESGAVRQGLSDGAISREDLADELGDVVAGFVAGRTDDRQITLYNSVGLGIQDVATARHAVAIARAQGLGVHISLAAGAQSPGVSVAAR